MKKYKHAIFENMPINLEECVLDRIIPIIDINQKILTLKNIDIVVQKIALSCYSLGLLDGWKIKEDKIL